VSPILKGKTAPFPQASGRLLDLLFEGRADPVIDAIEAAAATPS